MSQIKRSRYPDIQTELWRHEDVLIVLPAEVWRTSISDDGARTNTTFLVSFLQDWTIYFIYIYVLQKSSPQ